jgi:hypothetical protein
MLKPSFIMLYVNNPALSAEFYASLLEKNLVSYHQRLPCFS